MAAITCMFLYALVASTMPVKVLQNHCIIHKVHFVGKRMGMRAMMWLTWRARKNNISMVWKAVCIGFKVLLLVVACIFWMRKSIILPSTNLLVDL